MLYYSTCFSSYPAPLTPYNTERRRRVILIILLEWEIPYSSELLHTFKSPPWDAEGSDESVWGLSTAHWVIREC